MLPITHVSHVPLALEPVTLLEVLPTALATALAVLELTELKNVYHANLILFFSKTLVSTLNAQLLVLSLTLLLKTVIIADLVATHATLQSTAKVA